MSNDILDYLRRHGRAHCSDLGVRFDLTRTQLNNFASSLVGRGLVVRKGDELVIV